MFGVGERVGSKYPMCRTPPHKASVPPFVSLSPPHPYTHTHIYLVGVPLRLGPFVLDPPPLLLLPPQSQPQPQQRRLLLWLLPAASPRRMRRHHEAPSVEQQRAKGGGPGPPRLPPRRARPALLHACFVVVWLKLLLLARHTQEGGRVDRSRPAGAERPVRTVDGGSINGVNQSRAACVRVGVCDRGARL